MVTINTKYVEFRGYDAANNAPPQFRYKVAASIERENFGSAVKGIGGGLFNIVTGGALNANGKFEVAPGYVERMGKDFDAPFFDSDIECFRKATRVFVDGLHVQTWTRNATFGNCTKRDSFSLTYEFKPVKVSFQLKPIFQLDQGNGAFSRKTERWTGLSASAEQSAYKATLEASINGIGGLADKLNGVGISAELNSLYRSASVSTRSSVMETDTWEVDTKDGGFYLYMATMFTEFSNGSVVACNSESIKKTSSPVEDIPVEFTLSHSSLSQP
eukprot:TRINITY_DN17836_c0_g1_i1.p1 TRINITY_DN17836_c0_g1~~TRINITY_DN17836_c0_g1_i1.p1  ORF type:complete len:273 (-),score=32.92 TRINITY_DN17836_c0_g1_i1:341-1159(-)